LSRREDFTAAIARFKAVLAQTTEPVLFIGPYWHDPYTCAFHGHCGTHVS
jgi:hypothetical protein